MTPTDELEALRYRFLSALYDNDRRHYGRPAEDREIAKVAEIPSEEMRPAVDFLVREHLARYVGDPSPTAAIVAITHEGRKQVESARRRPSEQTQYFPPLVNITHVHSMVNSQIQQGSAGGGQVLHVASPDLDAVRRFVTDFAEAVAKSDLVGAARAVVQADLRTLAAQLQSPKPKVSIVGEGLRSIRTILEGAAGSVLASVWLPQLLPLLAVAEGPPPA